MKKIHCLITSSALAALALLLPCSLIAAPIVVTINDVPNATPVITVIGAPSGYDLYTGPEVATQGTEDGGLITLIGVDTGGSIPDWGGRFVVPNAPFWYSSAVDIVWVTHDVDIFGNGDLQVGFNSAFPGVYYFNPEFRGEENLGPVTDQWVTVYSDDTLVVKFKPHTYRLRN